MATESVKFDRAVAYYDETRGFPPGEEQPIAALIARVGSLNHSSRVIEIGVGTGRIALPLSAHTGDYYGLDISRLMIEKLATKRDDETVYPVEGDATLLPFPETCFDGAIVVHVFHLIPNWQKALSELGRVLRPSAPLIHCWTIENDEFRAIWDGWNEVVPTRERHRGMHWQKNPHFLEDEGWQPTGEVQTYTYVVIKSASKFLSMVKARIWSALWSVSDEEMERGLAVIEPLIQAQFPDRDAPIESMTTFYARGYLPHR